MVIKDLSQPQTCSPRALKYQNSFPITMAPVTDRFIAFILDFLILSPVVSFFVSGVLRNLKTVLILNSESEEASVIWLLFIFGIVGVSSVIQAVFLYFWQATLGQKFMQLQVVSYPQVHSEFHKLTFAQSLLRPLGWWMGAIFMGIPFLEILGHPMRRAFHERLTDTVVVSHKQEPADLPLPMETRYIRSTMWIFFGFLTVMIVGLSGKAYLTAVEEGLNGIKSVNQAYCASVPQAHYQGQRRLDMALALYFAEEVDEACVYTEAQKVVWTLEGEEKALGELAMAVISEDSKEAKAYQEKACAHNEKSEACAIARFLKSEETEKEKLLRRKGAGLISSKLLLLKSSLDAANYASAVGLIKDLEGEEPLKTYLNKKLVKAAWALDGKGKNNSGRAPASLDEKEILKEFKKRYEIE